MEARSAKGTEVTPPPTDTEKQMREAAFKYSISCGCRIGECDCKNAFLAGLHHERVNPSDAVRGLVEALEAWLEFRGTLDGDYAWFRSQKAAKLTVEALASFKDSCGEGGVMSLLNLVSTRPIAKALAKKYGGKWTYTSGYGWECDDTVRYVWRVATGRDIEGEYDGTSQLCLYYRDGTPSEWVYL